MATHVYIENIADHVGQEVELRGWLYNKRSSKKLQFLQVRDGTGIIQCVLFIKDVPAELFQLADHLSQETSIKVRGEVREDKRSDIGFELGVSDLEVVAEPASEYPITLKEHGVAFLLDHRHLWLRSKRQHAIMRIRAEVVSAIRDYFDGNGFTLVDAPVFTPAACEGTSTLFEVGYFGDKAYLTQSGQLYMEAAAMALGKVYCFGPTFRAEKSKTRRHLTEFWMVEPEVAYMDLAGDMDLAEDFVAEVVARVLRNRQTELAVLERDTSVLEKIVKPFPRISYDEAIERLYQKGKQTPWGEDLGAEEETLLSSEYDRPLMVHRYPAECKAFYMKKDPERPDVALCVDMLAPEGYGEIIGGGQREDDLSVLEAAIEKHQLPPDAFTWYNDIRRYGSVPHSGFGLGVERTVGWICGVHHIRECIPFPRMMERIAP